MPGSPVPVKDDPSKLPLFVYLGNSERERLPTGDYVRVVAQHMGSDGRAVRHDFALHNRGARLCRLLEPLLDSVDVDLKAKFDTMTGFIPPLTLSQATREGCECVFHYLDLIQTRVPTLISKPLRAPLEELTQPWEMNFLCEQCFSGTEGQFKTTAAFVRHISKHGSAALGRILEVAMLSDFLIIDPLRDLTCGFLASLGLSASSEKELLQLCGLSAPLTSEALEPLYTAYPFLRSEDADYP
ncbi:hypothetical protein STCU_02653 [Strigomonas culicis]|uniref:Uncharacterized protein n=1 Tax=Strigomonas culicis TaxID=28005 RepID=S9UVI2_9TRYP|nr:hypothetical protein STCU_02653 [Strigomonas culicis]|eukprot:EPY32784.1 hypothetical protein STCU_02653 [Strigomonas culicis]